MLRLCKHCGKAHSGVCDKQPQRKPAKKYERDPVIYHFRNSKAWRQKRAEIMERDYHLCVVCAAERELQSAVEVHHIVPLAVDYAQRLDDCNLISLCQQCHQLAEAGIVTEDTLRRYITARIVF